MLNPIEVQEFKSTQGSSVVFSVMAGQSSSVWLLLRECSFNIGRRGMGRNLQKS